jgi:hypothetical protein
MLYRCYSRLGSADLILALLFCFFLLLKLINFFIYNVKLFVFLFSFALFLPEQVEKLFFVNLDDENMFRF